MKSEFDILKYNENWSELFLIEKKKLTVVFGDNLNSIHHIGSTARFLEEQKIESKKSLTDKYIGGTSLRLRVVKEANKITYKLTQKSKLAPHKIGVRAINTLYLSKEGFQKMNLLQGYVLKKERNLLLVDDLRIGIDTITLNERLICIAEVEFESEEKMHKFSFPFDYIKETTEDESYTGLEMAKAYSRDN